MKRKKILYIDMDGVLVNFQSGIDALSDKIKKEYYDREDEAPNIFSFMKPMPGAIDAFIKLSEYYDTYILSTSPWNNPTALQDKQNWVKKYLGKIAEKKLIFSHHKNLNKGDFLVDDRTKRGADKFEGELILFGQYPYYDWHNVLDYLFPEHYQSLNLDKIIKNLMRKDGELTKREAKIQATQILKKYNEEHKERDEKKNRELEKQFQHSIDMEFMNLWLDHLEDKGDNDKR